MSLNLKIVKGIGWSGFQMFFDRALGFIVKLVLASILFPEDFGIIGMAAVFISIIQVFREIGMGAALVQKKEEVTRIEYSTAFWTTMLWSLVLYSLLYFLSPLIADFYNQEILTSVVRVLGIGIIIGPINLIQQVKLTRSLEFKKLAFVNNLANLIASIIAVLGALSDFGVWALVIQSTGPLVLRVPLFYFINNWLPSFSFSKSAFKKIVSFGIYTTGTDILIKVVSQADYLLVGKMLGSYELGIYSFAFLITSTLRNQFIIMINKVMFPIYSKFQNDPVILKRYYLNVVKLNTVIMLPLFSLLILYTDEFVTTLFPKWTDSIRLIEIFTVGVIINSFTNSFGAFLRGIGNPRSELRIQLFRAIFYIILIILGYYYYRLEGVAWAYSITAGVITMIVSYILSYNYNISLKNVFSVSKIPILCMGLLFLSDWVLSFITDSVLISLGVSVLVIFAIYSRVFNEYKRLFNKLRSPEND